MHKTTAYIGIGSNLGDKLFNCKYSIDRIDQLPGCDVITCSALFKTEPDGVTGQDWYANCISQIVTMQSPYQLLENLLDIEADMGRTREQRWGARTIDLDILLFGREIIQSHRLVVPHPLLHKRRFVLEPLNQLAPDLVHPVLKQSISQLLQNLPKGPTVEILKEEP